MTSRGKKIKSGVRGKNKKGKEKREKITLKRGKVALKMHLFGRGGLPTLPLGSWEKK